MRTYREVTYPEYKRQVLSEITCELCRKTTKYEWKMGDYNLVEVEVRLKTGTSYPEGGMGEEINIDICPSCFENKLVPWVQSQGGSAEVGDWEL